LDRRVAIAREQLDARRVAAGERADRGTEQVAVRALACREHERTDAAARRERRRERAVALGALAAIREQFLAGLRQLDAAAGAPVEHDAELVRELRDLCEERRLR